MPLLKSANFGTYGQIESSVFKISTDENGLLIPKRGGGGGVGGDWQTWSHADGKGGWGDSSSITYIVKQNHAI